MNLLQLLRSGGQVDEARYTIDDYAGWVSQFLYQGNAYSAPSFQQTQAGDRAERIGADFVGLATAGYQTNGVVFACMLVRQLLFSAVRFQYQRFNGGRPSEMFGDDSLQLLETPWPGGTTQDLLSRVIQDADLAGSAFNMLDTSFARLDGNGGQRIMRLRPDHVGVVLGARKDGLGFDKLGFVYSESGYFDDARDRIELGLSEVSHFAPLPDPLASWKGMSWLTPVIREIQADHLMNKHKRKFFEHGATPNIVISHPATTSPASVKEFKEKTAIANDGVDNAYKTFHIGGGADVTVVGANLRQISFHEVQGHGETRIAAAAGVPPVIVGLSEGLAAATYSNYGQARRRLADGTMHPLWQNVAGSFAPLMPKTPRGVRLWYDARDVPFLREDEKDAAEIAQIRATTMASLITAGYTPDSVKRAVISGDDSLLEHSGWFSVQLQRPGTEDTPPSTQEAP